MKAEELPKAQKYQTLQVLQDGTLAGVTRSHYCFAIFSDEEEAVYVCPDRARNFQNVQYVFQTTLSTSSRTTYAPTAISERDCESVCFWKRV